MFKRIFDINLVGAGGANSWNYSTFVFSGRIMFWFREKCFNMNWIWAAHKWTWSSERWLLKFSSRTSPNSYSGEIVLNERWTGLYHMIIGHQLNGYCDVVSILQYWYWHCDIILILWYIVMWSLRNGSLEPQLRNLRRQARSGLEEKFVWKEACCNSVTNSSSTTNKYKYKNKDNDNSTNKDTKNKGKDNTKVCLERGKSSCCNIAALQVQICRYMDIIQWISIYISIHLYKDMDNSCYNLPTPQMWDCRKL